MSVGDEGTAAGVSSGPASVAQRPTASVRFPQVLGIRPAMMNASPSYVFRMLFARLPGRAG